MTPSPPSTRAFARRFLGWDAPILDSICDIIVHAAPTRPDRTIDLRGDWLVLPGSRAARQLLARLVEASERSKRRLIPPRLTTPGPLRDALLEWAGIGRAVDELERTLLWAEALEQCRRADPGALARVFGDTPMERFGDRYQLAETIERLHSELARASLDFDDVAALAEPPRWRALSVLREHYLARLARHGVVDPYLACDAWLAQRAGDPEPATRSAPVPIQRLYLVGLTELDSGLTGLIDHLDIPTEVLIAAPESMASRFDARGAVVVDAWSGCGDAERVDGEATRIVVADRPSDQGDRVVHEAVCRGARADELTVGLADPTLALPIRRACERRGLRVHEAAGRPYAQTAEYRLLEAMLAWIESPSLRTLAGWSRHPLVAAWLERTVELPLPDLLTMLDTYHTERLPMGLPSHWLGRDREPLSRLERAMHALFDPWQRRARTLSNWPRRLTATLTELFGDRRLDPRAAGDQRAIDALAVLTTELARLEELTTRLALVEAIDGASFLRFLTERLRDASIGEPAISGAAEMLGWLELPFDDAPHLIVTGVNDPAIPAAVTCDPFLPDALRARLGLVDNRRRFARDAFAMQIITHTRPDCVFIVGRQSLDNDPLLPSRLLLTGTAEAIARRLRYCVGAGHAEDNRSPKRPPADERAPVLTPPRPLKLDMAPTSLRVTAFRDYLACPYRFYLRHIERLERCADDAVELDGGGFGMLLHDVLADFGAAFIAGDAHATTKSVDRLARDLDGRLQRHVTERFGSDAMPAVRVQIEQLRARLAAFARFQVGHARQGWRIVHIEYPIEDFALEVDGEPFGIRGRVDRIDVHDESGDWLLIDYKSSDNAKSPEQSHRRKRRRHEHEGDSEASDSANDKLWIDLQLPLYASLAMRCGLTTAAQPGELDLRAMVLPQLAYLQLSKNVDTVELARAPWTEDDIAAAERCAMDVIRAIREQRFWPPTEPPPAFSEVFSAICQDGLLIEGHDDRVNEPDGQEPQ